MGRVHPWVRRLVETLSCPHETGPVAPGSDPRAALQVRVASVTGRHQKANSTPAHQQSVSSSCLSFRMMRINLLRWVEAIPPLARPQAKWPFLASAAYGV